jgi:hypothetical protein
MSREDALTTMLEGIVEDMKNMYSTAGISAEESEKHIEQGMESFKLLCINMYERLEKVGALNNA